ncbi:uncharacterized protein PV09_01358 [Verruconis gallopava]|uniref:Peptidase A1 domain-containing protein n=1 Tax=Verruconis gallopava TaxID=253628 RepID=A0A0D2APJ3_9PEZI|nr:uncharacterized protein PV09_01358 [Verruconis gallopava]KIW08455.1 hypothetical protein PV09_01358 [Verruconis gallopava]
MGLRAYIEKPIAFSDANYAEGYNVPISPVHASSPSSRYIQLLLTANESYSCLLSPKAGTILHRLPERYKQQAQHQAGPVNDQSKDKHRGSSPIQNDNNIVYMTPVKVGGQSLQLVIDTGSSDTWLVSDPFQCKNDAQMPVEEDHCKFGNRYERTATFEQDKQYTFSIAYADGERLKGIIGRETVAIGGITNKNTTIALAHEANWHGDGVSSGLFGLAFPTITHAMKGDRPTRYDPVFFSMYKKSLIAPVFSVALNRKNEGPGVLSLGGLPYKRAAALRYEDDFAVVPMEKIGMADKATGQMQYTLYVADADGFVVGDGVYNFPAKMLVDTGTTMSSVPPTIMRAIEAAWSPPIWPPCTAKDICRIPCDSVPPKFAIVLGGKQVEIDAKDMVLTHDKDQGGGRICALGVAPDESLASGGNGLSMIGGSFMKSILVVFDVGAAELRFAKRVRNTRRNKKERSKKRAGECV